MNEEPDATVRALGELFARHPAWTAAARRISRASMSNVYFSHRPGEAWHLVRRGDGSALVPGVAEDPDFVFRFSPGSVRRLADVREGLGAFAAELFELIDSDDPEERVELRVVAPFSRLMRRGFVRLLVEAGPRIATFGVRRGVFSVAGLRRFVNKVREAPAFEWEI